MCTDKLLIDNNSNSVLEVTKKFILKTAIEEVSKIPGCSFLKIGFDSIKDAKQDSRFVDIENQIKLLLNAANSSKEDYEPIEQVLQLLSEQGTFKNQFKFAKECFVAFKLFSEKSEYGIELDPIIQNEELAKLLKLNLSDKNDRQKFQLVLEEGKSKGYFQMINNSKQMPFLLS